MPKHSLTFKHLLGESSTSAHARRDNPRERSVNDLLTSSRQAGPSVPRDRPPHLATAVAWTPAPEGVADLDRASVHPAELLRREQVAHAQAARSVAGPAPPRSWRPAAADKKEEMAAATPNKVVTQELLREAAAQLDTPRRQRPPPSSHGASSLVDACVSVILRSMRDSTVVDEEDGHVVTMGDAMLAGACQLDIRLRGRVLRDSALLLPDDNNRLRDKHVRALLDYGRRPKSAAEQDQDWDWDWDAEQGGDGNGNGNGETLHTLSLTCHPNPVPLLRDVPRFSALTLTTLNLAFSTLPADLDRLVNVLPAGLRSLGMAGAQLPKEMPNGYLSWVLGLGNLARKMLVLQTLDISYLPIPVDPIILILVGALPQAPHKPSTDTHLPSLRVLCMRGTVNGEGRDALKRHLKDTINGGGRRHWVEVVF